MQVLANAKVIIILQCVFHINMLYSLYLLNIICQLCLNKLGVVVECRPCLQF